MFVVGMHMDTDATAAQMWRIDRCGRELDHRARTLQDQLAGDEAGIGADEIGQAIRGAYFPARDEVLAAANRMPGVYGAAADAGNQSVADYLAADQDGAAAIRQAADPAHRA